MPGVSRQGDKTTTGHTCNKIAPISASSTGVFANAKRLSHRSAPVGPHTILVCYPGPPRVCVCENHSTTVKGGSPNVFVANKPVAHFGVRADKGKVFQSSSDVIVNGLGGGSGRVRDTSLREMRERIMRRRRDIAIDRGIQAAEDDA